MPWLGETFQDTVDVEVLAPVEVQRQHVGLARDVGRERVIEHSEEPALEIHRQPAVDADGVELDGHPDPAPLLLPAGGVAQPLRKEHVLAARQVPWPGAVDPNDSGEGGRPSKRRLQPPGAT